MSNVYTVCKFVRFHYDLKMFRRSRRLEVVLGGAILGLALSATQALRALPEREVATGCDAFGYLRSAQMIRRGEAFDVQNQQTRLLIEELKKRDLPVAEWGHAVAPHAYRYIEKSDKVSLQYPPGTGLLLALFPQGYGVFGLTLATIIAILGGAIVLIKRAWKRRDEVSIIATTVIAASALVTLERIGFRSFSINAIVLPLLLATWAAARRDALVAGALTGFCMFIRVPAVFVAPGIAWLACRNRRDLFRFGVGVGVTGVLPLAIYNWIYAGAPWAPTYGSSDTAGPTLSVLTKSIPYYLGIELGAKLNWVLILAGLAGWKYSEKRSKQAAFLTFLIGLSYFITHHILIPYYTTPSILAAVGCLLFPLALGTSQPQKAGFAANGYPLAALVGVLLIWPAQSFSPRTFQPPPLDRSVPAAMLGPDAWIWSDELAGTFLYEYEKPSFKPQVASPGATRALFEIAAQRKERQFLVNDIGITQEFIAAIERGAYGPFKLKPSGTAFGAPVFELVAIAASR